MKKHQTIGTKPSTVKVTIPLPNSDPSDLSLSRLRSIADPIIIMLQTKVTDKLSTSMVSHGAYGHDDDELLEELDQLVGEAHADN